MTNIAGIQVHPAAEIFPLIEGAEFDALCDDIAAHGLRESLCRMWVTADDGTEEPWLLDGRNRLRACERLGIKPEWRSYDDDDPIGFVLSLNMHRRHLTESQRAIVTGKIATLRNGGDRRSDGFSAQICALNTQAEAAKLLSVSRSSAQSARKVLDRGNDDLVSQVERGDVKVSAAATVAKLPDAELREVVAKGPREIKRVAAEMRADNKAKRAAEPDTHAEDEDDEPEEWDPDIEVTKLDRLIRDFVKTWPDDRASSFALEALFHSWMQQMQRIQNSKTGAGI